ncbi:MAG: hypothetical protein WKF31_04275 [Thermoleophilaceae bacterium]
MAAAAHEHDLGVLHYDRDYDHILEHTTLEYVSRWIAAPAPFTTLRRTRYAT